MAKLSLGKILVNGKLMPISSAHVYDAATGEAVSKQIADIQAKIADVAGGDVSRLKTDLAALKATFDAFMTGEDDNNGALDRLKELVAAIQANKDSIDALLTDKATKAELEAVIARVQALEDAKDFTGIAIGATPEAATDYTGKIQIIVEEFDIPDVEPAA